MRNCGNFGADFISIIGTRYRKIKNQAGDTLKIWRHTPVYEYLDFHDFYSHIPHDCQLISVEVDGADIAQFKHPERCVYLFGPEDGSLPEEIPGSRIKINSTYCLNLAVTTGIIMYDRTIKGAS